MHQPTHHQGKLYLLAAPLGNLGDVSSRLLAVLRDCDLVAAEDTRVARKLLSALGIRGKKVLSIRQHNEAAAAAKLAADTGKSVAYLCDAGTPGVSDPGAKLVTALRAAGFGITAVPGPSAVTAALSVSGLGGGGHVFGGFLSRRAGARRKQLAALAAAGLPLVLFEAPGRIAAALRDIAASLGADTTVCLCRELTKKFEQVEVAAAPRLAQMLADGAIEQRGEFTLVVAAAALPSGNAAAARRAAQLLAEELPLAKACKLAGKLHGTDAKALYRQLSAVRA